MHLNRPQARMILKKELTRPLGVSGTRGGNFAIRIASRYSIFRKSGRLPALIFLRLFAPENVRNIINNIYRTETVNEYNNLDINLHFNISPSARPAENHTLAHSLCPVYPGEIHSLSGVGMPGHISSLYEAVFLFLRQVYASSFATSTGTSVFKNDRSLSLTGNNALLEKAVLVSFLTCRDATSGFTYWMPFPTQGSGRGIQPVLRALTGRKNLNILRSEYSSFTSARQAMLLAKAGRPFSESLFGHPAGSISGIWINRFWEIHHSKQTPAYLSRANSAAMSPTNSDTYLPYAVRIAAYGSTPAAETRQTTGLPVSNSPLFTVNRIQKICRALYQKSLHLQPGGIMLPSRPQAPDKRGQEHGGEYLIKSKVLSSFTDRTKLSRRMGPFPAISDHVSAKGYISDTVPPRLTDNIETFRTGPLLSGSSTLSRLETISKNTITHSGRINAAIEHLRASQSDGRAVFLKGGAGLYYGKSGALAATPGPEVKTHTADVIQSSTTQRKTDAETKRHELKVIADSVYKMIEKRLVIERERKGL